MGRTENIFVTLESFSYCESAENGMDINAEIVLKEYRSYGTVTYYPDTKATVPFRLAKGQTWKANDILKPAEPIKEIVVK